MTQIIDIPVYYVKEINIWYRFLAKHRKRLLTQLHFPAKTS